MKDWSQFKAAVELQNQASRSLLQLRNGIIRNLKSAIPEKEKTMGDSCCVVVSLKEICTVRSFSPADYLVKTQVQAISEVLMKCQSASDLQAAVQKLAETGRVSNGSRMLTISKPIRAILQRYVIPVDPQKVKVG